MSEQIYRLPGFLGEAREGHTVSIQQEVISFENGVPVVGATVVTGKLSYVKRVNQIPKTYIYAFLTEACGRKHEVRANPDLSILFVHRNVDDSAIAVTVGTDSEWAGGNSEHAGLICRGCYRRTDIFRNPVFSRDLLAPTKCDRCGTVVPA